MQIIILQGSYLILVTLTPTGEFRTELFSLLETLGIYAERDAAIRAGQDALDRLSAGEE